MYIFVHLDHFLQNYHEKIYIPHFPFVLKPIVFFFRLKQKSGLENMPSRPSSDVQQLVSHDVATGLGPETWFKRYWWVPNSFVENVGRFLESCQRRCCMLIYCIPGSSFLCGNNVYLFYKTNQKPTNFGRNFRYLEEGGAFFATVTHVIPDGA